MPTIHPNLRAAPAALLFLMACSPATSAPSSSIPAPVITNATPEQIAAVDSVRRHVTPADIEFMSGMIGHHAQAIQMSEMAPTHGAGPQVTVLAARIINAQKDEIATMQQWLKDRGQPVPEAVPGMKMPGHGDHLMLMPGMLTPEQMAELDAARGAEFDRLFLTYMIQHHNGALAMVQKLFSHDGAAQEDVIFKFASDVNVDQVTEVDRMRRMLFEMTVGSTGP